MLAATFPAAGQPAADKCRIEGTVLNAVTGQPIRKARITLTPVQGEPFLAATDAHGKYAVADLAPGKYSFLAGHDGYTDQRYGAKRPGEEQKGERDTGVHRLGMSVYRESGESGDRERSSRATDGWDL